MFRARLMALGLADALLAGACGGGGDSDPAERGDEAGRGASFTSGMSRYRMHPLELPRCPLMSRR